MGVGSEGQGGPCPSPLYFIHGSNIVDRGLKVLFFDLFCYFSVLFFVGLPLWKRLNSAIFPGKFSADALVDFLPIPVSL